MRRFGHGHSLALGVILTLALERHWLVFALLVFVAGVAVGRGWATLLRFGYFARRRLLARAANLETRRRPLRQPFVATRQSNEIPW